MAIRCLLVDDDTEICALVADYLQRFGMACTAVPDGRAMHSALQREQFDLLLLDLMLPGEDGLALCRALRREKPGLPVIMLTAQGDPLSRVLGLEMGADDYLPKPFEPRELVARINAVLRRARGTTPATAPGAAPTVLRFDGWQFDRVQRELTSPNGVLIALSGVEARLLAAFTEGAGRVLSRALLVERVASPGATERSIDLAVSRLRAKLGDDPRTPRLIRTQRGEGYLFNAKVRAA
jgi:two-component system, OmpR family, response regulator